MLQREFGNIVAGAFTPVLAKHTKSLNLIDTLAVGVDRIQRSFEPMRRQVESWRQTQLSADAAKLILYRSFVEGDLDAPRSLLSPVHRLYFEGSTSNSHRVHNVESLERIHKCIEGTRPDSTVQGHGEAGSVSVASRNLGVS